MTKVDTTIRYYRKKLNMRQSDLAQKLGITPTDMSFYENKHKYPNKEFAEKLSEILEVPIGKLYQDYELELMLKKEK